MVQSHSVCPLRVRVRVSLFGGLRETWRKTRGPRHSALLRQSLAGREELAKEPLRLLRS